MVHAAGSRRPQPGRGWGNGVATWCGRRSERHRTPRAPTPWCSSSYRSVRPVRSGRCRAPPDSVGRSSLRRTRRSRTGRPRQCRQLASGARGSMPPAPLRGSPLPPTGRPTRLRRTSPGRTCADARPPAPSRVRRTKPGWTPEASRPPVQCRLGLTWHGQMRPRRIPPGRTLPEQIGRSAGGVEPSLLVSRDPVRRIDGRRPGPATAQGAASRTRRPGGRRCRGAVVGTRQIGRVRRRTPSRRWDRDGGPDQSDY